MKLFSLFVLACLVPASGLLGGCTARRVLALEPDGTYCYRTGRTYQPTVTCTVQPVPPDEVEVDAKRFAGAPGAITLYIIRRRWGDPLNQVPVSVDQGQRVLTVPNSVVRVRLAPGVHRLELDWEGRRSEWPFEGNAGEVMFVELAGSVWAWGDSYALVTIAGEAARSKALRSKLIADLDLRREWR